MSTDDFRQPLAMPPLSAPAAVPTSALYEHASDYTGDQPVSIVCNDATGALCIFDARRSVWVKL